MSDGETKPKVEGGASEAVISLKVKDSNGGEVVFKVKRTTKFEKIMQAFCQKKAWDISQVRFVFDGQRVQKTQTPADLDMEDGDVSFLSFIYLLVFLFYLHAFSKQIYTQYTIYIMFILISLQNLDALMEQVGGAQC